MEDQEKTNLVVVCEWLAVMTALMRHDMRMPLEQECAKGCKDFT